MPAPFRIRRVRTCLQPKSRARFGFSAPAAIFSQGDGQIDPYRFTQALLKASREQGLRAFQNTSGDEDRRVGHRRHV